MRLVPILIPSRSDHNMCFFLPDFRKFRSIAPSLSDASSATCVLGVGFSLPSIPAPSAPIQLPLSHTCNTHRTRHLSSAPHHGGGDGQESPRPARGHRSAAPSSPFRLRTASPRVPRRNSTRATAASFPLRALRTRARRPPPSPFVRI